MNITSKLIKIEKSKINDKNSIENEIKALGINPIRWAIVNVDNKCLTINVAHENLC